MRLRETDLANSQSQSKRRPTGLPLFELSQITEEDPPGISLDETTLIGNLINGVVDGGHPSAALYGCSDDDGGVGKVNCSDMVPSRVTT